MAQSWFADPELLTTNLSVSYLPGNLSQVDDMLVYAHADDVAVINVTASPCVATKLPITEKSFIHQVRLCTLQDTTFIVVASDNGVQIFDAKGKTSLYELALKDALDDADDAARIRAPDVAVFCRGIAAIDAHDNASSLVIGTSLGKLLVLGFDSEHATAKATDSDATHAFELRTTLSDHKDAAIAWVESSSSPAPLLASSDDTGLLLVRSVNVNAAFDVVYRATSDDAFAITSMCFVGANQWLVTGDVTGKLRIYKRDDTSASLALHAEVAAHTRGITALAARESQFASVSDDTFLNVWAIAEGGNSKDAKATRPSSNKSVQLVSSHAVSNDLLTGVAFAGAKRIVTAAYDTTHVKLWVPE